MASRSLGSTSAPHFIILSTSLVQAGLLNRCCTMMRASWQVEHAAAAFSCMGSAGNLSFELELGEASPANATALKMARVRIVVLSFRRIRSLGLHLPVLDLPGLHSLGLDIDLHLIAGVVEIAAGIPHGGFGLHASLAVGGPGEDYVVAAFGWLPTVGPETPRVFGLVFTEFRLGPSGAVG